MNPLDDDDYPLPHLPPDAKPKPEAAKGDEDMMQEPPAAGDEELIVEFHEIGDGATQVTVRPKHPIQKIEDHKGKPWGTDPPDPGFVPVQADNITATQLKELMKVVAGAGWPRPNTYLVAKCPKCGHDYAVNMEPDRKDPYENTTTGC